MKLVPLTDRVVVKASEVQETTKSGIVLTGSAQEKPQTMDVVAVGPGTADVVMNVQVGQKVILGKYAGTMVKLDGVEYTIVKQEDILAIVEE